MTIDINTALSIPGKPKPKPAGGIKYGRNGIPYLSMNKNGYMDWKNKTVLKLKGYKLPLSYPYGIIYLIRVPNLQGLGDITNIMEALQDCLVESNIIEDDRPSIVKNVSVHLEINQDLDYQSMIYLCYNPLRYITQISDLL